MKYRSIAGQSVAVIALGSTEFGGKTPAGIATEILDAYSALGGNFIDTARVYGDFVTPRNGACEEIIGRWMEERNLRDTIFLSTKGGHPPLGHMDVGRLSREEIIADMKASLDALRTDHVDIYWLHRDDPTRDVGSIMETLAEIKEKGYTRLIGVSNWRPCRIREANAYARRHGLPTLDGNQLQFSLAQQMTTEDPTLVAMDDDAYRLHKEENLLCCCFASLAKGFFSKLFGKSSTTSGGAVGADREQLMLVSAEDMDNAAKEQYAEVLKEAEEAKSEKVAKNPKQVEEDVEAKPAKATKSAKMPKTSTTKKSGMMNKVVKAVITAVTATAATAIGNEVSNKVTGKKSKTTTKDSAGKVVKNATSAATRTITREITRSILGNLGK